MAPGDGIKQERFALDVEERVVLAGEARGRQVLGCRRAAHRDRELRTVLPLQAPVGVHDLLTYGLGQASGIDQFAAARADLRQPARVGLVEAIQELVQLVPGTDGGNRLAESVRGRSEAFGTRTPCTLSSRYISPSDAFLPPTSGTSSTLSSSNQRT